MFNFFTSDKDQYILYSQTEFFCEMGFPPLALRRAQIIQFLNDLAPSLRILIL